MAVRITWKGINSAVWSPRLTRAFNRMRQGGVHKIGAGNRNKVESHKVVGI